MCYTHFYRNIYIDMSRISFFSQEEWLVMAL